MLHQLYISINYNEQTQPEIVHSTTSILAILGDTVGLGGGGGWGQEGHTVWI